MVEGGSTKFNVKHQGKDIHHPPSIIYKWPLNDLPELTLYPSLSLSFTIIIITVSISSPSLLRRVLFRLLMSGNLIFTADCTRCVLFLVCCACTVTYWKSPLDIHYSPSILILRWWSCICSPQCLVCTAVLWPWQMGLREPLRWGSYQL